MNDIEILEQYVNTDNKYAGSIEIEIKEAIKSVLKERQADKDRINILRDRAQEQERTYKETVNMFAKIKKEYEDRIKELEEDKDTLRDLYWNECIPKSLVKEKIEELNKQEKAELKGMKGQDRYVVKQEYQHKRNILQELLGESYD